MPFISPYCSRVLIGAYFVRHKISVLTLVFMLFGVQLLGLQHGIEHRLNYGYQHVQTVPSDTASSFWFAEHHCEQFDALTITLPLSCTWQWFHGWTVRFYLFKNVEYSNPYWELIGLPQSRAPPLLKYID